jgi:hypothetical protein
MSILFLSFGEAQHTQSLHWGQNVRADAVWPSRLYRAETKLLPPIYPRSDVDGVRSVHCST